MVFEIFISLILTAFCTLKKSSSPFPKIFNSLALETLVQKFQALFPKIFLSPFPKALSFLRPFPKGLLVGCHFFKKSFHLYFYWYFIFFWFIICLVCSAGPFWACWVLYSLHLNPFAIILVLNSNPFPKVLWALTPFPKAFLLSSKNQKKNHQRKQAKSKRNFRKIQFLLLIFSFWFYLLKKKTIRKT